MIVKSWKLQWAEHVARMEQARNVYREFGGGGKRQLAKSPLGRLRKKWRIKFRIGVWEVHCEVERTGMFNGRFWY
jgi:hypothetical protein